MMTVKKNYEFDPEKDLIGRGGFGNVYKARDVELDMVVAIKQYTGNLPEKYSLFQEIKRAIKLNHPNLVRYYDAFALDSGSAFGDKIQVGVMEYINGGDLMDLIKKKPSQDVLGEVFIGIIQGLQYLHRKGVIHRDMKPENILIQTEGGNYIPKIADFGISKVLGEGKGGASSLVIGSLEYMAPEQFNVVRYGLEKRIATNLDLWSLGTMMYEAFLGRAPFGKTQEGVAREQVMQNILEKDLTDIDKIPQPYQDVVLRCLVRKAEHRAQSADELLGIMAGLKEGETAKVKRGPGRVPRGYRTVVLNMPEMQASAITSARQDNTYVAPTFSTNNDLNSQSSLSEKHQIEKPKAEGGFNWVQLIPYLTAFAGYAFFNSKRTLLGWETAMKDVIVFPAIVCAVLIIINLLSLVLRKTRGYELAAYLFSFTVLGFYLAQSLLINYYENLNLEGLNFNFTKHSFAEWFPIVGAGIIGLGILGRITKMRWFEVLPNGLSYIFLSFIAIGIWLTNSTWIISVGVVTLVGLLLAGILWKTRG